MSAGDSNEDEDRRTFLKSCGRFAAITPPAITLLLSTSLTSRAIGRSGGGDGGRHGDDGKRSFFDNDHPSTTSAGTSGGSSFEGLRGPGGRGGATSGGAGGTSGGGSPHGGGGSPMSIASSGTLGASGDGDCAEEENDKWRRKVECTLADLKASSSSESEH